MRILHVVATLNPEHGGPPAVVTRLAAAQTVLGHEAAIVAHASPQHQAQVAASLDPIPHISRVKLRYLPAELILRSILPRQASQMLAQLIDNADIVHLHGVWEPLLLKASLLARQQRVPYVITPHGMLDPWSLRHGWLKKKLAMLLAYRRMLHGASLLHALTSDAAGLVGSLRLSPPIRVVANGISMKEIDPLPQVGTFRARFPQLGEDPYVLFLSRLHHKKGLDYLADAFAIVNGQMPNVRLVVVGPDGGAQAGFVEQVKRLRLSQRVHVVGPLYGPDRLGAMVDAACFCLPSRQEGFSVAILEALACGLAVVISEPCHFAEVAEEGAGLVVPLSANVIAQALVQILSDDKLRAAMGWNGRDLVIRRYTWEAIAQQLCREYDDAINRGQGVVEHAEVSGRPSMR